MNTAIRLNVKEESQVVEELGAAQRRHQHEKPRDWSLSRHVINREESQSSSGYRDTRYRQLNDDPACNERSRHFS